MGGTFADHRIYPGLKSNNQLGTYEYPDFHMDTETFGVKARQHIPGQVLHTYLKAYASHFGLNDLIRLNTKVIAAEHQETAQGGWVLTVLDSNQSETKVFARKMIVATGLTSEAFLPHFDGQETFGGKVFHGKYFLQNKDTIQPGNSVTVFGATKFAWDAVYAYATAGVKVDWVIRCKIVLLLSHVFRSIDLIQSQQHPDMALVGYRRPLLRHSRGGSSNSPVCAISSPVSRASSDL